MDKDLKQEYFKTPLNQHISIKTIVTVHYFEFPRNYLFPGEKHDFWEFLYVDKGAIEVLSDNKGFKLEEGDIIFHKPNEFHTEWANGKIAPNVVVISFGCKSKAMNFFEDRILKLDSEDKKILGEIIKESKEAFTNSLGPHVRLEKRKDSLFCCEQLIKNYLEILFINLVRKGSIVQNKYRLNSSIKDKLEGDIISSVIEYMKQNIDKDLSIDNVCCEVNTGKTRLKETFKNSTGQGIITYFKHLKIDEAKKMIREEKYNFTEVAERLGYDTIHSFSRTFKEITGMTPSQYASSVKAMANI